LIINFKKKQAQANPKFSRSKEVIKVRSEIDEMENKQNKISETEMVL
jgi:hypothetical protein